MSPSLPPLLPVLVTALLSLACDRVPDEQRLQAQELSREAFAHELEFYRRRPFGAHPSEEERDAARQALEAYQRSAELHPGALTPDRGTNLEAVGRMHLLLGEYDQAATWLERAQDDEPGKVYACSYYAMGSLYRRLGDPARAQEALERALARQPGRRESRFLLAQYHLEVGEPEEALQHTLEALALFEREPHPDDTADDLGRPTLLALEGYIRVLRGELDQAQARFEEAIAKGGPSTVGLAGLAHVALARHDLAEAERLLERARLLERQPVINAYADLAFSDLERDMVLLAQGWLATNRGRHEDALAHFRAILAQRPHHVLALTGQGDSLSLLARWEEAERTFDELLELVPGDPVALAGLGVVALNRGELERAEELLERAAATGATGWSCPHEGLGQLYLITGREELAERSFRRAIELEPTVDFRKYNGLARIHLDRGEHDEARALLERSLHNAPDNPEALGLLAKLEPAAPPPEEPTP
jgi:tetratricopeptide (TPR) repeat protein